MSALAEQARSKAREKVERLTRKAPGKVDASGWREPLGEKGGVQTGPRPVSRRQFRRGGKVHGEHGAMHAGRKPRASGGMTANEYINRNVKTANESRDGEKQVGGMKHGGSCRCAKCGGGSVGKKAGGSVSDGTYEGTRPQGGRLARKGGGRAKKAMNVNIIIAPGGGGSKPMMPPPGVLPPGGPVGMHQGAPPPMPPAGAGPPMGSPMMRKSGGRAYPISNGAGGGKGRLEKARAYGG